jgi:CRP-like cAMP-binding protein
MSQDAIDFGLIARSDVAIRSFKQGDTIFKEGDPASELYVIAGGNVEIRHGNRLLATLDSHSIFGEMALIDGTPRSATAVAASDVTLVPWARSNFCFWSARRRSSRSWSCACWRAGCARPMMRSDALKTHLSMKKGRE